MPGGLGLDKTILHRRATAIALIVAVSILAASIALIDPWVSLLAGILVLLLAVEVTRPVNLNRSLVLYLTLITIITLAWSMLFDFYAVDLGYRLKELGIAIACITTAFYMVVSMVSHTKLSLSTAFAILSTLFISFFLVTLLILNLLVFDTLAGHTLIVDNRWMMFVVTEVSFIILAIWVAMVFLKRSIPFKGTERWSA